MVGSLYTSLFGARLVFFFKVVILNFMESSQLADPVVLELAPEVVE